MSNLQHAYETEMQPQQQLSLQLVPAVALAETAPPAREDFEEVEEDLWGVWPYSWAVALYNEATDRFHSFHEKHEDWELARHNQKSQQKFRKRFWRDWDRGAELEGVELRVV